MLHIVAILNKLMTSSVTYGIFHKLYGRISFKYFFFIVYSWEGLQVESMKNICNFTVKSSFTLIIDFVHLA